jgi:hypothetical protein
MLGNNRLFCAMCRILTEMHAVATYQSKAKIEFQFKSSFLKSIKFPLAY